VVVRNGMNRHSCSSVKTVQSDLFWQRHQCTRHRLNRLGTCRHTSPVPSTLTFSFPIG
jgi:hypothetical protein